MMSALTTDCAKHFLHKPKLYPLAMALTGTFCDVNDIGIKTVARFIALNRI